MYINFIVREAQIFSPNFLILSLFFKRPFCLWIIFKVFFYWICYNIASFGSGGGYEAHGILAPWLGSKPTLPGRDVLAAGPPSLSVPLLALGHRIQAGYQTEVSICKTPQ